jgi:hypothetical protein
MPDVNPDVNRCRAAVKQMEPAVVAGHFSIVIKFSRVKFVVSPLPVR